MQVPRDRGQRHVHDGVVHDDQEDRDAEHEQHQPSPFTGKRRHKPPKDLFVLYTTYLARIRTYRTHSTLPNAPAR